MRRPLLSLAAILAMVAALLGVSAAPAAASCILDCYQFTSSGSNIYAISSRDCSTCTPYSVWPGSKSHMLAGGVPFYVPAGCVAKTSTFGDYWAYNGWHWFPHHYGTITMRPDGSGMRSDC